jgi:hypothetical protein
MKDQNCKIVIIEWSKVQLIFLMINVNTVIIVILSFYLGGFEYTFNFLTHLIFQVFSITCKFGHDKKIKIEILY